MLGKRKNLLTLEEYYSPKVSIIIPVYNTARFLSECIDSILNQNYRNLEVICIDDGSTDASLSILDYYAKSDSRLKYFHQENQGQSVARNHGLDKATGDFVCFLDSDDLLINNAIYQCVETFYLHKCIDAVLFNMEMFLPDGQHYTCLTGRLFQSSFPILSSARNEISVNFTNAAAGMYKRSSLVSKHIRFPVGIIYEDWVFMVQYMVSQDIKFFWLDTPLYWYRRGFASSTTSDISRKCLNIFQAYEMADRALSQSPVEYQQKFINDYKITNEGIGFLTERIFQSDDTSLICDYLTNLLQIIWSFPKAYLFQICNELSDERRFIAIFLYSQTGSRITPDYLSRLFSELRKKVFRERKSQKTRIRLSSVKGTLKNLIKKVLRTLFPSYRVSNSIRTELETVMGTVNRLEHSINQISSSLYFWERANEDETK